MTPTWFTENLNHQPSEHFVDVRGAKIHYLNWLNPGKPGLLFIHGHAAHAHWWDFIAPGLATDYSIAAIDLSGSGDSDHRKLYSTEIFAEEIAAVIAAEGWDDVSLVAHSFGGVMARCTTFLYPGLIQTMVLVDSVVNGRARNAKATEKASRSPRRSGATQERIYETISEGQRRFRLKPPQPCENAYIIDHISRHSLKKTPTGYTFKLDRKLFPKLQASPNLPNGLQMVQSFMGTKGFVIGEDSHFFTGVNTSNLEALQSLNPGKYLQVISGARHHVFLDKPQSFVRSLKTLLSSNTSL
jgi:pimeloyl-ACP methyl ester carboxylesterase